MTDSVKTWSGRPETGAIPSGDRSGYSTNEGQSCSSPSPGRPKTGEIPSGDRSRYSTNEGQS